MATNWTVEQLKAISEYGGNILVSAAAGSGKTAVLVERILNIIKEKTDVDKMLIVTFTNAAAAELRERLYTSLQKELDSPDISPIMAKRLSRQQMLLSKSYITTIDSFCKTVVSSNPVESGFDASFRLADEGEIAVVKADAVENVLERRYASKKKEFMHLVEGLAGYKDDKKLVEQILDLYRFAQSNPIPEEWLILQKSAFDTEKIKDFSETPWYKEIIKDLYISFEAFYDNLFKLREKSIAYGIDEYEKMLSEDLCALGNVVSSLQSQKSWSDVFAVLSDIKFNRAPSMSKKKISEKYGEEVGEIIEFIKNERNDIKKEINNNFQKKAGNYPEAPLDDIKAVKSDMCELIDITLEFSEEFNKRKADKHIMTFDDISHKAFDVLADKDDNGNIIKSDVAKKYCKCFEEVYIDEYQDTNELQDAILYLVSRNSADAVETDKKLIPNMFMVGDVKQSIYGFRQARPDIFTGKYKSYGRGENSGKLIVLNKNFRSRQGVIESVNTVFKKIMTENTCGIEYTEDEYLNFGAEYYPETPEDTDTELYLIKKSSKKENYEPEVVAQIVKNLIDSKFQVLDKETKQMRDVTYRDIVILMRSPNKDNKGKTYVHCMKNVGVPAFFPESGGFFANAEINILLSFMKTVDNPLQDIHFVATLRNIYGFSDTDIARIKNDSNTRIKKSDSFKTESFYEMCKNYSDEGELKQNISTFLSRLEVLRKMSKHVSVSELLWTLMHENHFYEHLVHGPLGELHIANIHLLYSKAIKYDSDVNRGLFRFLYYFDDLKKRKADMDEANAAAEGMNVVRILSIHKSKGLEFPVVILSDTGKTFNSQDLRNPILKHRLLGLGPTCYLEEEKVKYPSVMKFCVARRLMADNKAEEMRVLYVAMTRAAEKLIITGTTSNDPESFLMSMDNKCSSVTKNPLPYSVMESKNFLSWIAMCKCADESHIHMCYDPDDIEEKTEDDTDTEIQSTVVSVIPQPAMTFYQEKYNISYNKLPAKISVSELKRLMNERETSEEDISIGIGINKKIEMSALPDFEKMSSSKTLTPAQIGTAVHICIQLTDYSKLKDITKEKAQEYIEELLLEAQDRGFLKKEQAESVDKQLIVKFYMSDIAKKIALADEIMKEVPFTQLEEIDGEVIAVQGVIDCVIKEKDKYTVIDFKTDEVADGQKYKAQLAYYAEAVRKVFGAEPEKIVYFIKHNKQEFV